MCVQLLRILLQSLVAEVPVEGGWIIIPLASYQVSKKVWYTIALHWTPWVGTITICDDILVLATLWSTVLSGTHASQSWEDIMEKIILKKLNFCHRLSHLKWIVRMWVHLLGYRHDFLPTFCTLRWPAAYLSAHPKHHLKRLDKLYKNWSGVFKERD